MNFRSLAPGQHSYEETLQRWRAVGDIVSDLTGPGIEAQTSCTDSDELDNWDIRPVFNLFEFQTIKIASTKNAIRL